MTNKSSNTQKIIFHIDGDAFYASVEESLYPELKKVPMAIVGDPKARRGIVLAKNQLAKEQGVKTAETVWKAQKKSPKLVLAPARHDLYSEFCYELNEIYKNYTDRVEKLSIDESFLDVTGSIHLFKKTPLELAALISEQITKQLKITVSIGISFNKIFAKMGSDLKKPDGISIIKPSNYKNIIWPMPIENLYSVGDVAAKKLRAVQIVTIGDIAQTDKRYLEKKFGKAGVQYYVYANGLDDSPVRKIDETEQAQSVGNGQTFAKDLTTKEEIKAAVMQLSDTVATRLRKEKLKGSTVQITIKDPNFKVITRQIAIQPTWLASDISATAYNLLETSWRSGAPIRMLTVTTSNLITEEENFEQLNLFEKKSNSYKNDKKENLESTVYKIRKKYGKNIINSANIIDKKLAKNNKKGS